MFNNGVILATASYDHTIKLWNQHQECLYSYQYSTKEPQKQDEIHKEGFLVNKIEISHDKQYLGAATSFLALIYDLGQAQFPKTPVFAYNGYKRSVTSIGFFKQDNRWIYTSSEDGSIQIHDLTMKSVSKKFSSQESVNQVVLHPNEVELISAHQDGNLKVWDLRREAQCIKQFNLAPNIGLRSVSIALNGQFFCAADSSGTLFIQMLGRSYEDSSLQKIENAHDDYILKCQISPLVKYKQKKINYQLIILKRNIVTCSADKTIKIWSLNPQSKEFEHKNTLFGHQKWVWDVAYGCDGEFLFSCSSDNTAKLWKLDDQQNQVECFTFKGHKQTVNCAAINDLAINS